MQGSNIFVIYADAENNNVTLSPRLGTGEVEPLYDDAAQAMLLAGSGIINNTMIANILCHKCRFWAGGSMAFNDPQSNWIWAWKQGNPISSSSPAISLEQHDNVGQLTFDLTKATGNSESTNPFASLNPTNSNSSSASGEDGGGSEEPSYYPSMKIAHGSLLGVCMVLLLPSGAALRRLAPRSSIWLHAGWQMFGWCVALAGMGIGIWMALVSDQLDTYHAYIGIVVVCTMALQPILGLLQHAHFRRTHARSPWAWVHKVLGTAVILLGIINGGLGLDLSDNSNEAMIAYAVMAGFFGTVWLAIIVINSVANHRARAKAVSEDTSSWVGASDSDVVTLETARRVK
jgi:Cytochrome domain of cellobiose dehydrogenase/Eukaryotic cytochrome b561